MNLKPLLRATVSAVKRNPHLALAIVGLLVPKLARKVAPVILAATRENGAG